MSQVSHIDQRLAANYSKRQVENLVRIESTERRISGIFRDSVNELTSVVINSPQSFDARRLALETIIGRALKKTRDSLELSLRSHAKWAADSTVDALMSAVPLAYNVSRIPPESRAAFEQVHHPRSFGNLNFSYGTLWISTEAVEDPTDEFQMSIPLEPLAPLKLTEEQYEELVKRIVFPSPSEADMTTALKTFDWEARLDSLSQKITDKQAVLDQLIDGYASGESPAQLKKRVQPLVDGIQSSAKRIARTESMRVAETMQRQTWDALGDMMVGAQVIAVLDERTRPEHATRNGRVYYRNPRGNQLPMSELPDLPDAPNCRCMTVPVMAPPEELKTDPEIREAFKTTARAGTVDALTYNKWFSTADIQKRKAVVGVKRYTEVEKLVGRTPTWSDFVNELGELLSLDDLSNESVVDRTLRKEAIDAQMEKRRRAISEIQRRGFEWPRLRKRKPR